MTNYAQAIDDHYGQADLGASILAALERAGKDVNALTRDDIASFDEFHIRGRKATRELAHLADLKPGMKVLDIGCGIGGAARTLADESGCHVTGIDLVQEYCRTAQMLSERVGANSRVTFRHGDVMNMSFDRASFDAVLSQHVLMNIEDKARLFKEVRRVLQPEGRLVLYEICGGSVAPPHYPVPWASDASINFLVKSQELRQMLDKAGFEELTWRDVTAPTVDWFRAMAAAVAARPADTPPPLGLHLLMGSNAAEKVANLRRNLEEERSRVVQGVLRPIPESCPSAFSTQIAVGTGFKESRGGHFSLEGR